jgi:hypothetical protein
VLFECEAGVVECVALEVGDVVFGVFPYVFDGVVVGCVGWHVDEVNVFEFFSWSEEIAEFFGFMS